jgi:bifunctional DNA-binding transcriptional regulator/antitoxin component of YhaV-PrlF toxin-antitoxin module
MATLIREHAQLRARHQLTIPDAVVRAAGIEEGETFVVEVDPAHPDTVRLERLRTSYAGALRGVYGDTREYLDELRRDWDR